MNKITKANATPENVDKALSFKGVVYWEDCEEVGLARRAGVGRILTKLRNAK